MTDDSQAHNASATDLEPPAASSRHDHSNSSTNKTSKTPAPRRQHEQREANDHNLDGLWVPIITPFRHDGSLDNDSLLRLSNHLLEQGATGLVALGTTGEPSTLTVNERLQVVTTCAAASRHADRPLIVGIGTNSTQTTLDELDRVLDVASPAAVLVVVPYYNLPSPQAVIEHFGIIADASPVPIHLYNIPYRTGRGLDASALLQASQHPNICGLKQAVGALDVDTLSFLGQKPDTFRVFSGDDAFTAPTILMGGAGAIAASAHVCTGAFVQMTEAALAGNAKEAVRLANDLLPIIVAGSAEPNPALWKAALASQGLIAAPNVRRPLTPASPQALTVLLEELQR